jgi:type II secretory pathway component PulM
MNWWEAAALVVFGIYCVGLWQDTRQEVRLMRAELQRLRASLVSEAVPDVEDFEAPQALQAVEEKILQRADEIRAARK